MATKNLKQLAIAILTTAIFSVSAAAGVSNIKDALDIALKNKTIAKGGGKMKLYSINASYNGANKRWTFQFYDGGSNIHSVSIDKSGKARYYRRDKGSMRIFDEVDFSKLPAPSTIFIDDIINKSTTALKALGFTPVENGKLRLDYYLRNEYRQKDKAYHSWRVTIPIGKGKEGKTVTFKNGAIETVSNATIY